MRDVDILTLAQFKMGEGEVAGPGTFLIEV